MRAEAPACPPNARQSRASTRFLPIRIDRSGKPRRPGANDHDVKNTVRVYGPNKSDAASQLSFGWVAQHPSVRTQDDRQLAGIDMKAFDQRFCFLVFLRIKFLMRMTIATEKAGQSEYAPAFGVPDNYRTAGTFLEQTNPTQDQRAHDALAEFSFSDQQRA